MVTRLRIGRRGKSSANIGAASGPKYGFSKYLNNLIEQDHRSIKLRLGPMIGLKCFRCAAFSIAGISRIGSGKIKLGKLRIKDKTMSRVMFRSVSSR